MAISETEIKAHYRKNKNLDVCEKITGWDLVDCETVLKEDLRGPVPDELARSVQWQLNKGEIVKIPVKDVSGRVSTKLIFFPERDALLGLASNLFGDLERGNRFQNSEVSFADAVDYIRAFYWLKRNFLIAVDRNEEGRPL